MKTLQESILDNDFDSHLEDVCQIPMDVLADALESYGPPLVLKKYLKEIHNEGMFDQIWEALSKSCDMMVSYIKNFSRYELDVIKKFVKQNPIDSQVVKETARKKIFTPLENLRELNGRNPLDVSEDVEIFLHPDFSASFYDNMSEFYFFINSSEAGWISIKKKAKKEHVDLLKYILK